MKAGQIIQVGGKSYIRSKVVMLPTEKASKLALGKNGMLINTNYPNDAIPNRNDDFQNQALYFLSEEEIKEGDWFFDLNKNLVTKANIPGVAEMVNVKKGIFKCKKIIASTDESLNYKWDSVPSFQRNLPRPSNEFLQAYCKANGKIDEALIEYEQGVKFGKQSNTTNYIHLDLDYKLKVSPDNTITCKKVGIDLQKIEQNIDEVLAKETPESLTEWLLDKRKKEKVEQEVDLNNEIETLLHITERILEKAYTPTQIVMQLRIRLIEFQSRYKE